MKLAQYIILLPIAVLLFVCCKSKEGPVIPPEEPAGDNDAPVTYTYRQTRSSKRGVCFNTISTTDLTAIKTGMCWLYNWDTQYSAALEIAMTTAAIDFIPMAWNGSFNANNVRAHKARHPECKYILAFNEPNHTGQANMTPAQAAAQWPALKSLAQELNLKIVAPALNYGTLTNYSDPIDWLDDFFKLVPLSDVDAIAIHCYMNYPAAVKWFTERFYKYNKPIWMTEFCAWENNNNPPLTLEVQRKYMSQVVNYFETNPRIERYAWFMFDGSPTQYPYYALSNGNKLSDLGTIYTNLSSQDKNTWYAVNEVIPAEHYSQTNVSTGTWADGVTLNLTSDKSGILEISEFSENKWLEYQVNITTAGTYNINLRYAAANMSLLFIKQNNNSVKTLVLPATGGTTKWTNYTETINLPAGQQTLRFTINSGEIFMNWWKLIPL